MTSDQELIDMYGEFFSSDDPVGLVDKLTDHDLSFSNKPLFITAVGADAQLALLRRLHAAGRLKPPNNRSPKEMLMVTLRDDSTVVVWQEHERPASELAAILRLMADGFDDGPTIIG